MFERRKYDQLAEQARVEIERRLEQRRKEARAVLLERRRQAEEDDRGVHTPPVA